jgi:DNA polymerase I-like protein with 3'-5' exonuclease and polymerase domains
MKPIQGRYLRNGRPMLLVVGIRPGKQEISAKSVFVGPSGKLLVKVLNEEWPHGVYLMNAIPSLRGNLDEWFHFTLSEASSVNPDYVVALGAEARLWAIRAVKDLPNVKRVRYHQNPAAALEGHIPIQRWMEIMRGILRTLMAAQVGITVKSPSDVVAVDTECKGHPCDGFQIVAATDGERELVTDNPDEIQRFIKGRHIVAHNAVYDLIALESRGVKVDGQVDCTMTMKGILDPEGSRDLDILAAYELRVDLGSPPYTEWKKGKVSDQIMGQFALYHARATLELYKRFSAPARAYPVYTHLYQPLLKVLSSMSRLRVDLGGLERKKEELLRESQQISEKLREFSGINWNSYVQVAEYFMKTGSEIPLTEKGHPSVSEEVLKSLDREEARLLLRKREIEKLLSTYVGPILTIGELRTVYDPVGARTGRMCVSRDTLIEMPRDLTRYPDGVPITELKPGDWVYSFTWDRRLCLKRVKWVGPTGFKPVVKVTIRDEHTGETRELKLTEDHLVRMYDGDWRPAGRLVPGNRLLCMVRRGVYEYAYFFPSSKRYGQRRHGGRRQHAGKVKEHRWVYAQLLGRDVLPSKWDVHHKDGNKLNNHPDNLELVYHEAHLKMHRPRTPKEDVVAMLEGRAPLSVHPKTLRKLARFYGLVGTNHTVISVEPAGVEEVWDVEVEETHTFIGNGVALHNSSKNMNAQNIPNEIRKYILPPEDHYWMEADYKSAEYAVAAYWSQDPFMLQALKSGDIHTYTARLLIGRDPTPDERRDVKAITFGLLYLATPKTVSEYTERLGGSGERAYEMYDRWWDLHRGYLEKIKWLWGELNTHGIYAGLKRRYRCPNGKVTIHDLRLAVNQIIQGGASDVTAEALLKVS